MAQYDIVLFGASSFVGEILVNYMADNYSVNGDVSWAIAGRSQAKLQQLKEGLGETAADLPIIIADASNQDSIDAMVQRAGVLISTVGPYAMHGEPVVKACVAHGTDYCDLTGEPQWIKKMIDRYQDIAQITGARIIHCCGFDSIPSDLGVYFLQQNANEQFGEHCSEVKMRVKTMKGSASGGTVASMLNMIKEASLNTKLLKLLMNPYALCPNDHQFTRTQIELKTPAYDTDLNAWVAPFVMAAINTRIVHRSNALLDNMYGTDFKYDEAMVAGKSVMGGIGATAFSAGMGGFVLAAAIPPSRWLLENTVLPKPGEGPSPKEQFEGSFDLHFLGKTQDGKTISCDVTGDRDPGYGSTAKMLAESAICLAKDIHKKDKAGGFWTPASAFGNAIIKRLQENAGLVFSKNK